MPSIDGLKVIGCQEHKKIAEEIADKSITLVKNTRNQLPIRPETHRRIMFYPLGGGSNGFPGSKANSMEIVKEELEKAGFEVTLYQPQTGANGKLVLASSRVSEFVSSFDAVMLFANIQSFSQSNVRRITWSIPMGPDIPWYVTELPTVFVSLCNPFHLLDAAMVPTYINAYEPTRIVIQQTIKKIMGDSEFKGVSPVDAFCDLWDTHL